MGNIKKTVLDFEAILSRIKKILQTENDKDVAIAIGMKPNAFYNRKATCSVPLTEFVCLANTKNINIEWLINGTGSIYKNDMVITGGHNPPSEKTIKSDTDQSRSNITTVVIEHQDVVKRFKNPEKAKEFNEFLVEIEGEDPEGYDELFKEARSIYKTIKRIKNKDGSKKTPNDGQDDIQGRKPA